MSKSVLAVRCPSCSEIHLLEEACEKVRGVPAVDTHFELECDLCEVTSTLPSAVAFTTEVGG